MALVRILVDGYSLLHNWPELAPGRRGNPRPRATRWWKCSRSIRIAKGTPVTVFIDGTGSRRGKPKNEAAGTVEVLFSRDGQTADDLIERAAHRFQEYGEVLVVTDDYAERDMVSGFGGSVASCANFIGMIGGALNELQEKLKSHNRAEQKRFTLGFQKKLS